MSGGGLIAAGEKISRVLRVFGKLKFVQRLHDFLAHGGRASRADTLVKTANVALAVEQAKEVRTRRLASIVEMMKSAGFTQEQIQDAVRREEDVSKVGVALETLLHYVEWGQVRLEVLEEPLEITMLRARTRRTSTDEGSTSKLIVIPKKKR